MKEKGLLVGQLIENTYDLIVKEYGSRQIILLEDTMSEIAEDSDSHRTCTGYMKYISADILDIEGSKWVIARGTKYGAYPAAKFDSDLFVFPYDVCNTSDVFSKKNIKNIMYNSPYFKNSLIASWADGNLFFIPTKFSEDELDSLYSIMHDNIIQNAEYGEGLLLQTLTSPVLEPILYKDGFGNVLKDILVEKLKEMSKGCHCGGSSSEDHVCCGLGGTCNCS
ncbi:MAG: hypothetical protein K0B02_02305 [DPANN group archaeon]|nr:hypothetical protein [DPANN group archaeon]